MVSERMVTGQTDRPEIDGLRGVACLVVLVFHALAQNKPEWAVYLTGSARIGVWLFFVLSAFLLTLRLLETGLHHRSLINYSIARVLRIIPLFVGAVLLYHSLGVIGLSPWIDVVKALTFQGFYNHLWTVPIEFEFYLLLPVVVFIVNLTAKTISISAGLFALAAAMAASMIIWQPNIQPDQIVFGKYLACFGSGVFAAYAVEYFPRISSLIAGRLFSLALLTLVVFIAIMKTGYFAPPTDAISGKHPFFGAIFAVMVFCVYSARTVWSRALAWRPLSLFGLTIYSTYLFHWIPMHYIAVSKSWWAIPLSIAISILLGTIGYRCFETRLYKLRRPAAELLFGGETRQPPPGDASRS